MVATGWTEIEKQAVKLNKSKIFKNVRGVSFMPTKKTCILQIKGTKPTSKRVTKIIKCNEVTAKNVDMVQSFSDGSTMMDFRKPTTCGYSKLFDMIHCPPLKK